MLRRARIEKIITNNTNNRYFSAIITWLDRDGGMYDQASFTANIQLSYNYISRSFGFQYYPVPGDIVLCGFCEEEVPVIIAFLTTEHFSKISKDNIFQYYFRNIVEGEYSIKALQGNEIYFDRKGSLRFIIRDQEIISQNLQSVKTKALNSNNYIRAIKHEGNDENNGTIVDLTRQVLDYPKIEMTIGKVFDEEYKEEKKLNDTSLAIQIIGKTNKLKEYDENGKAKVETEETYKVQINVEGEIAIGREDGKYTITINKEGEISLTGTKIQLSAEDIIIGGEPGIKGSTLFNWCNTHTHSNGNNGSPTGNPIRQLTKSALIQKQ